MAAEINSAQLDKKSAKSLPLYEQIRQHIQDTIESQGLQPGDRLPSVSSLVRKWDVHTRTVKSALSLLQEDGVITMEPRRAPVVSRCVNQKVSLLFVRWHSDPLCVGVAEGLQKYAAETGSEVVIVDACHHHQSYIDAITHPPEEIKGLALIPFDSPQYRAAIQDAMDSGLKVVLIDRILPGMRISAVTADHYTCGYQGTTHLIEQHHLPVHYVGTPISPSSQADRVRGWSAAMQEHNFDDLQKYVWELPLPELESTVTPLEEVWKNPYQAALRMFKSVKADKISVFAGNDYIAKGIYVAAEELGLKVGRDVYLVGFGGLPMCTKLNPPLTSGYQPQVAIGYEAAKLLHQEITGQVPRPIHRVLPVDIKIRASSLGIETQNHNT